MNYELPHSEKEKFDILYCNLIITNVYGLVLQQELLVSIMPVAVFILKWCYEKSNEF
jgi:hypothetical protein